MGRVRQKWIKSVAKEILEKYYDKFTNNFDENKKILKELGIIDKKTLRNRIAGYITHLKTKST
jgi:small subunit ribosomal protein S17e